MNFSFGSDPELMLIDKNGKYKSAIGIVQGNKDNRIKINGHEFYYDNVLAECAIKPSFSKEEAVSNFKECLKIYSDMVDPFKLQLTSSHNYEKSELKHDDAKLVGCEPEYCPYEMKIAEIPTEEILHGTLRTCGGHIHLGSEYLTEGINGILAMYMMDIFLGIPSLWLDKDQTSKTRREMYGEAGRYRVKSYGMEYRSLSNFWLQSPRFVEFIYEMSEFVVMFVESGKAENHWSFDWDVFHSTSRLSDAWKCLTYNPKALREAIKTGNKGQAKHFLEFAKGLMPENLKSEMLSLFDEKPKDFYKQWGL